MIVCVEDFSGYLIVRFSVTKAEIPNKVKEILNQVECETENSVNKIVTDNGSEFINFELQSFLEQKGINHEKSAPYTTKQNGRVERAIQHIKEVTRTVLFFK